MIVIMIKITDTSLNEKCTAALTIALDRLQTEKVKGISKSNNSKGFFVILVDNTCNTDEVSLDVEVDLLEKGYGYDVTVLVDDNEEVFHKRSKNGTAKLIEFTEV